MLITVSFSSNITKHLSERYLSDFLLYATSLLQNEYPNIKLELYTFTRDINKAFNLQADIYIDDLKSGYFTNFDDPIKNIHNLQKVQSKLKVLWQHYTETNPYKTEDK
ncbi:hypothetical protein BKG95_00260 [Rodentibacter pneumotropicus]|uniref:Uncharacterized protein n=1 Tax=Rodentibacter pneumotropicus TaxID=758 RepID=A0AAW5LAY5_9PAST|nr:hypothetical protein [Rodentibacter pneumotropicus]MCQ9120567.1 hypothetical protein [Rodentibacter pneumotropicus]OOF69310.1 hypothetical protein BKG95_00260 [Rodentibacter pneumotropicus]